MLVRKQELFRRIDSETVKMWSDYPGHAVSVLLITYISRSALKYSRVGSHAAFDEVLEGQSLGCERTL